MSQNEVAPKTETGREQILREPPDGTNPTGTLKDNGILCPLELSVMILYCLKLYVLIVVICYSCTWKKTALLTYTEILLTSGFSTLFWGWKDCQALTDT